MSQTEFARAFVARQEQALDAARTKTLAGLAARVRELTEAVLFTDVPDDEVAAVEAEIAALTARLSHARRPQPPVGIEPGGRVYPLASPVTGPLNPIAPPLEMTVGADGTVRGRCTLNAVYEGPPTLVHGGVTAMILDHLLGAAVTVSGSPGMTASLDLRYRRPTPYGVPLTAEAWSTHAEGRRSWAEAHILDPDGRVTVEATAMFIMPRE